MGITEEVIGRKVLDFNFGVGFFRYEIRIGVRLIARTKAVLTTDF